MVKLVWRLSGVFIEKTWQIKSVTRQSRHISMKSITLYTVSILTAFYILRRILSQCLLKDLYDCTIIFTIKNLMPFVRQLQLKDMPNPNIDII